MRTSLAVLVLTSVPAAAQTTWYVDVSGTPPGSGTQMDPYTSIQFAIERPGTVDGDTLEVAPGTYTEHVDFSGKAITVVAASTQPRPVIDAAGVGSAVTFASGETRSSALAGFVIAGGAGTDVGGVPHGGGIFIAGAGPRLVDLVIEGNSAKRGGGLAALAGARPAVVGSRIADNEADDGGGVWVGASFLSLGGTDVVGNEAVDTQAGSGGGLFVTGGSRVRIEGGNFEGNRTAGFGGGGGLGIGNGQVTLRGVRFFENDSGTFPAPGAGGAISVGPGSTLNVTSCVFDSNGVTGTNFDNIRQGGAILFSTSATATVRRTLFQYNEAQLGGAVSQNGSSSLVATYYDCTFIGNRGCADLSGRGGAGYGGRFVRCTFRENFTCGDGGAVYGGELEDCLVVQNRASGTSVSPGLGGGILGGSAHETTFRANVARGFGSTSQAALGGGAFMADLERCILVHNEAERGAGAYMTSSGTANHCTFAGNVALFGGGGLFGGGSMKNGIAWANLPESIGGAPNVTWSAVEGGYPGTGNIAADPLLWGPYSGDAHLRAGSPAIDAGDPTDPPDDDGSTADMGALPFDPGHVGSPGVYCTASEGADCIPAIASSGNPSLSGPDDFVVTVEGLPPQGIATLFTSGSAASLPTFVGTLCLGSPVTRVRTLNINGAGACGGSVHLFLSQATLGTLGLMAGDRLYVQVWFQGPGGTADDTGYSAGIEATILP